VSHSIKLSLSRSYFSESYDAARRYGSRWLLVERVAGVAFTLLGIGLMAYTGGKAVLPFVLIAIGVVELLSNRIQKYFWLRRESSSKVADAEVRLVVDDEGIQTFGPFATSRMRWNGIEKVVRTPRGILVWPHTGIYIYLPESVAGKDTIDFIASKVA
jgi:hypothetical protein